MLQNDYTTKLLGLEEAEVIKIEEREGYNEIHIKLRKREHTCPKCGEKTEKTHDYRWQTVKDLTVFGKNILLYLKKRRYVCVRCGKRFAEEVPFLPKYHRVTNRLISHVLSSLGGLRPFKDVALEHRISPATAMRYFKLVNYKCKSLPEVLSIDEFRGNAGGERFQCILADPKNRKVLDILPNRKQEALMKYFHGFSTKNNVIYFVMDMNRSFLEIAAACFPRATVVIDRYHVVRQVLWDFEKVRRTLQQELSEQRRKYFKRSRKLLLKRPDKLKPEEVNQVEVMLRLSPRLAEAYHLKNRFLEFMRSESREEASQRLKTWVLMAECANIPEFRSSLTAIHNWDRYILNAFACPYTNGFTEGCNNKIKVLKRISFGVRNFPRFRNRILHIMNSKTISS